MNTPYRIALDIGTTSVGWAVLTGDVMSDGHFTPTRIKDAGVRMFDEPRKNKQGSLKAERGQQRRLRRVHRRRVHRITRTKRLLARSGFGDRPLIENWTRSVVPDVYTLRYLALQEPLTNEQLVRVLVFLVKHRGFQSMRNDVNDEDTFKMRAMSSLNEALIADGWARTWGDWLYYSAQKRNCANEYVLTPSRSLVIHEAETILNRQRQWNPLITPEVQESYLGILKSQRTFDTGPGDRDGSVIADAVGFCTFEPKERRAPKASYSFERFRMLQRVSNLRIRMPGIGERTLLPEERNLLIRKAYQQKSLSYRTVRHLLQLSDQDLFVGLPYGVSVKRKNPQYQAKQKQVMKKAGIPQWIQEMPSMAEVEQKETFVELTFYHGVASCLPEIAKLTPDGLNVIPENRAKMDELGQVLSEWKSDMNRVRELRKLRWMTDAASKAVRSLDVSGFGSLSIQAIRNMLIYMEQGDSETMAKQQAGYPRPVTKQRKLPRIPEGEVTNPIVLNTVQQVVQVVNAIIDRHGSPVDVHIEVARDLGHSAKTRQKIQAQQVQNRQEKDADRKILQKAIDQLNLGRDVTGTDLLKYKLWKQQGHECIYSGKTLTVGDLLDPTQTQVDHIIPWSLSLNDSQSNKVVVTTAENQNKGSQTPYEYFGQDVQRWVKFMEKVQSLSTLPKPKKLNLLETRDRRDLQSAATQHLIDTQYTTTFIADWIRQRLIFDPTVVMSQDRVFCVKGGVTAFLRHQWGLIKNRADGDLHHAMDAMVIGVADAKYVQRIVHDHQGRVRSKNLKKNTDRYPLPWDGFDHDVVAMLDRIFVSRKPLRKTSGPLHAETIYGEVKRDGQVFKRKRVPLTALQWDSDTNSIRGASELGKADPTLYEALCKQLKAYKGDAKEAFAKPFYKPVTQKIGKPQPNKQVKPRLVKKITIEEPFTTGVEMRKVKGLADNPAHSIIRVDVFRKNQKYYLVPIYTSDIGKALPIKACTINKHPDEWAIMDESFEFQFSLHINDLVYFRKDKGFKKGSALEGRKDGMFYYQRLNVSDTAIHLISPDGKISVGIGASNLNELSKRHVSVLGDVFMASPESRRPVGEL